MTRSRFTVLVLCAAVVAIVAVAISSSGGISLPFGGDEADKTSERSEQPGAGDGASGAPSESQDSNQPAQTGAGKTETEPEPEQPAEAKPAAPKLPENPDDVRGSDPFALTRPANLRRALAVLERTRRPVEGVYDGLRVAPGRIDTVIIHPDDRRTNIQVRADFTTPFKSTHDFPTRPDFRQRGMTARDVDVRAPARLLEEIDGLRRGSAARDVDYLVISKDIIDFRVNLSAYMRIRTPRPRTFSKEAGEPVRAIG